ncbi:MAG: PQQ-dependent sugar dehydrogenase [Ilumatobacteraceae bacterium]
MAGEPVVVHCVDELDLSGAKLRTTRWGDNFTHAFTPGNHNGGGIATDGQYLYIGTGDDTQSSNPGQDPSSLKAKIVRMPISTLSPVELVALGIRQPFGLIMNGNELIEFDVGLNSWEEINRFVPDAANPLNFGWKTAGDGDATAWLCYRHPGSTGAPCDEPSVPSGYAIMGGAVVDGHIWFADHPLGWVGRVPLDRSGPFEQMLATSLSYPTKLAAHPNGSSVYVVGRDGDLWRLDAPQDPNTTTTTSTTASSSSSTSTTTTTTVATTPVTGVAPSIEFGDETAMMNFPITINDVDADAVSARYKVELAHADEANNGEHEHPVVPWTDFDPAWGPSCSGTAPSPTITRT